MDLAPSSSPVQPGELTVLGLESSCDESAAAILRRHTDGRIEVLADLVLGQTEAHAPFGGVVPEIAARAHAEAMDGLAAAALSEAGLTLDDVDAIAATSGPGLIGGVMAALMTAKGLALGAGKPLIAVNHLEGHALSPRLSEDLGFPYLLLLVSGGHTQLLVAEAVGRYRRLGSTLDDAAGEAFDKTAKVLGLGFPGGPALERCAEAGDAARFDLPTPLRGKPGCDFSFAGLKTAARQIWDGLEAPGRPGPGRPCGIGPGGHRGFAREPDPAGDAPVCRDLAGRRCAPSAGRGGGCRGQPCRAGGAGECGGGGGFPSHRTADEMVHRQCCHDRAGWARKAGAGRNRRAGCTGAGPLAIGCRLGQAVARHRIRTERTQSVSEYQTIGVIGAGAWGTALAQTAAKAGRDVILWSFEQDVADAINTGRRNTVFLPDVELDPAVGAVTAISDLDACDAVLAVAPAQHLRRVLESFAPYARDGLPLVLCAKGIEQDTLSLMTDVLSETIPRAVPAVLSGPSFAIDTARGLPTAVTLACADEPVGNALIAALGTNRFRPYLATDLVGARDRWCGEERAGDCLRHFRGAGAGQVGACRPDLARVCGNDAAGRGHGRAARDPGRPLRAGRSGADMLLAAIAQHVLRARAGARRVAG